MARRRLTKEAIDKLKARPAEYTVYDTDVPRFGVRVMPSGRKTYLVRMRVDGRQRWYRIGPHGEWTAERARAEAQRVIGQASAVVALRQTGSKDTTVVHPIEARDRQRATPTVAAFAERYVSEYAEPHKAPATVLADRSLLGLLLDGEGKPGTPGPNTIVGRLGHVRMDRLTAGDVTTYHLQLRATPTRANRALALLSHMSSLAERWGVRAPYTNPCRRVDRFEETRRERFLSSDELARLGVALEAAEKANKLTPFGLAAIRLLVFTGARASEILGLTWADVKGGTVRLRRKGRLGTLQLPPPARAVLKRLVRIDGNPFVVVGGRAGRPLTLWGLEQCWQEIRKVAGLDDVRLHDLRHSFASVAAGSGESLPVIGALLGHTVPATTARYAHLAADPLAAAAKATARTIASAMGRRRRRA
jgi:integrase